MRLSSSTAMRRFLKIAGPILFGILSALIVAEIGARVLVAREVIPNRLPSDLFVSAPIGWTLQPNVDALIPSSQGLTRIQTNSLGFRDTEHSPSSPRSHVLILGDSFTAAMETPQAETFHAMLQQVSGEETEFITMGVSGYEPTQYLLAYKQYGRQFKPKTVLVMFYAGNDMVGNRPHETLPYYSLGHDGTLDLHNFPYKGRFEIPLIAGGRSTPLMKLSEVAFIAGVFQQAQGPNQDSTLANRECDFLANENWPSVTEDDWAITEAILKTLHDEVESDGADLRVAIIPTKFEVAPEELTAFEQKCPVPANHDQPQVEERLETFFRENGIAYHNLLPDLLAARQAKGEPIYIPGIDTHWTPLGHSTTAKALHAWLGN